MNDVTEKLYPNILMYVNFEEEYPEQVNNLRKLFPKLEEDGNPFIAIYSL